MLKFFCIVRTHRAELLCEQLLALNVVAELAAEEVLGRGRRTQRRQSEGGGLEYLPKVIVSGYIECQHKDVIADIILSTCRSGHVGDGKIFFYTSE